MRSLVLVLASITGVFPAYAQRPFDWERVAVPALSTYGAPLTTAVDPGSGLLVTYGGGDGTWAWNGVDWFRPRGSCEDLRTERVQGWLLADHVRGRLLLLGGFDGGWQPDPSIWGFQASCWRQISANSGLALTRGEGSYSYDAVRDRIVALRYLPTTGAASTLEWDGTSWQQIATTVQPPLRSYFAMAYDATRQRTVVFGGHGPAGTLADTWEWDGATWRQLVPTTRPPAGAGLLTFDPVGSRCLLQVFAGGGHGWDGSIWSWNGTNWSLAEDLSRFARQLGVAVFDPQRQSYFFLERLFRDCASNELSEWDGSRLQRRCGGAMPLGSLVENPRRGRLLAVTAWDPDVVWQRGSRGWHAQSASSSIPSRSDFGIACDPIRDRLVLFGGRLAAPPNAVSDQTFEWDGHDWRVAPGSTRPPARVRPGLAFDATSGEVLMFGGDDAIRDLSDTWSWNGVSWRQRTIGVAPPARSGAAMAADPMRRVIVLHGGSAGYVDLADTWEWDGTQWSLRNAGQSGGPVGGRLAFDAGRQVMVAMERVRVQSWPNSWSGLEYHLWDWDGTTWRHLQQPYPAQWSPYPGGQYWEMWGLAWDPEARSLVAVDGLWGFTREVGEVQKLATITLAWSGCASNVRATLDADRAHVGQDSWLRFDVNGPPGWPLILLAGAASQQWNGAPLPIDLTAQGATGCLLLVAPQVVAYLGVSLGPVVRKMTVPNDPNLAGHPFDFQGVVLVPGVNPAGVLLSNSLRLRIGLR